MSWKRTALLIALAALVSTSAVGAGAARDLAWWTVDGGGTFSTGGSYTLAGTIGQPDAGALAGGDYALGGGFWGGGVAGYSLYLPLVLQGF